MEKTGKWTNILFFMFYLLFLSSFFLSACAKEEKEDGFRQEITRAFAFIEEGFFEDAEAILNRVKREDPGNCEASWGKILVSLRKLSENINSLLSIFLSPAEEVTQRVEENLPIAPRISEGLSPDIKKLFPESRLSQMSLSALIQRLLTPFFEPIEEISRNIDIVLRDKCKVGVALPLRLGPQTRPFAEFYLGEKGGQRNKWGPTEAAAIGLFSNLISALMKFVLSINFDINLEKLLEIEISLGNISFGEVAQQGQVGVEGTIQQLSSQQIKLLASAISFDVYDTVALFGSLAYIIEHSPDLFKLKEGAETTIDEVPEQISHAFFLGTKFFEYIQKYSDRNSILAYTDVGGDGLSPDDFVQINVFNKDMREGLYITVGDLTFKVDNILVSLVIKPFLSKKNRDKILRFFNISRKAFDVNNPNIKEEERWINIAEFRIFLPFLTIPPTLRINPRNFFEGLKKNPEGLRALLPLWSDLNEDGNPEFVMEAEARNLEEKFCLADEDRVGRKFLLAPDLRIYGRNKKQKRVSILLSKGNYTFDGWCRITPELTYAEEGNYSIKLTAEMKLRRVEMIFENSELNFHVFSCSDYLKKFNIVCYEINLAGDAIPKVFIRDEKYDLKEVLRDPVLLDSFESLVIPNFTVSKSVQGKTLIHNVYVSGGTEQYLYVTWNEIELPQDDPEKYTVEVFTPKFDIEREFSFSETDTVGCVSGYCTKGCSGITCRANLGEIDTFISPENNELCVRVYTNIKGVNLETQRICYEFSRVNGYWVPTCKVREWLIERRERFGKKFYDKFSIRDCLGRRKYKLPQASRDNPVYIMRETEIRTNTCFSDFKIPMVYFPMRVSGTGLSSLLKLMLEAGEGSAMDFLSLEREGGILVPDEPRALIISGDYGIEDIKSFYFGESARNYISENISFMTMGEKYRVFSAFFSPAYVERRKVMRDFPNISYVVFGCSSIVPRCFFNRDSPHFPSEVVSQGVRYNPKIKSDCMFPDENWSFYYVAFKDPTFFNAVQVNLEPLGEKNLCPDDPRGWVNPDGYLINKVVADLILRTVSPLISLVADLGGLFLRGPNIRITQGDLCGK